MASRRSRLEGFSPFQPTKITTRKIHEPRDECARLPKSYQRRRPTPIDVTIKTINTVAESSTPQKTRTDSDVAPCNPEMVDSALSGTWPRRSPSNRLAPKRVASPSTASELSFGVLDYYLSAHSGLPSPKYSKDPPRIETPVIDPAMEKFNFDLGSSKPTQLMSDLSRQSEDRQPLPDTGPGAETTKDNLTHSSPPSSTSQSSTERKKTYSLFPNIELTTPTRRSTSPTSNTPHPHQPTTTTPQNTITILSPHEHPDTSYRPRKESISSSIQSRKDSLTSFSGTKRIPMRVLLSSSSNTPKTISTASNSTASPPQQPSRWSDDTIASPSVVTTPGLRTSFGPLLGGRDSVQYPACFFEDDNDDDDDGGFGCETVPLRRKLRWHRPSPRFAGSRSTVGVERFDGRRSGLGWRFARVMLCGCC